jgi:quinol monooxygenase YgiN
MVYLTVVAKVVAKKDVIGAVKIELLKLVEPTRKEDGCLEYKLHQDNADPAVFIFYETWESRACLEKHMNTDHFKNYLSAVEDMVAEKAVHIMTLVA